jgi:hypothetical protein
LTSVVSRSEVRHSWLSAGRRKAYCFFAIFVFLAAAFLTDFLVGFFLGTFFVGGFFFAAVPERDTFGLA